MHTKFAVFVVVALVAGLLTAGASASPASAAELPGAPTIGLAVAGDGEAVGTGPTSTVTNPVTPMA